MTFFELITNVLHYVKDNTLETIAVSSGIFGVWLAKKENIWLYPVGIVSVSIWVYLCWVGELFGQSLINLFFLIMNGYGWYNWSRKNLENKNEIVVKRNSFNQNILVVVVSVLLTVILYYCLLPFQDSAELLRYVGLESFITALNFVAMWLMAWKKVENWILWIIGDLLCIPLFIHKGYYIGVIQFSVFIIIAYLGYQEWKSKLITKA